MTNNQIQIQPGLTSKRLAVYLTALWLPVFTVFFITGRIVIGMMHMRTPLVGWLFVICLIMLIVVGFFIGGAFDRKDKAERKTGYTTRLGVLKNNPKLKYVRTTRKGYADPNLPPQLEKFDFKLHTETE